MDAWLDVAGKGRSFVVTQNVQNNLGITDGEWKYIPAGDGPAINKQTNMELANSQENQLYRLTDDVSEQTNLYEEKKEIAEKLEQELVRIVGDKYGL